GDGLLIELGEDALDGEAQVGLDDRADAVERLGPGVVLQPAQFLEDVRRDEVGPGGEELPELDVRGPELVEHRPQAPAAAEVAAALAGRLLAPEDVAEAVSRRDLGDLAHPRQILPPLAPAHGA